jgi:hypothetical protein
MNPVKPTRPSRKNRKMLAMPTIREATASPSVLVVAVAGGP